MNSLSWLIYLGDVAGSLNAFFGIAGFFALLFGLIAYIAGSISRACKADEVASGSTTSRISAWDPWIAIWDKIGKFLPLGLVMMALASFIPSKNTIYAIAASEMGEKALKTEIVSDATKALHSWIKKQIEPSESKSK